MPAIGKGAASITATCNRHHGVMHMLAILDLTSGKIHYRIRCRKRHHEFLDLLKTLRTLWLNGRLHLVADDFSAHGRPDVRDWGADHNVELVFLLS